MARIRKPPVRRGRTYLKEWREFRGLTLEAAANRLDVHHTTVMRLEAGKVPYNQDILERMAFAYNCEVDQLLKVDPRRADPPRLVYDRLKNAPKEVQNQALAVIDALLKTGT